jgi:hypothetical protein
MPILRLLAASGFNDEMTAHMGAAFDGAWESLQLSGSPLATEKNAAMARELLAKRIIEMGSRGITDPLRLMDDALAYMKEEKSAGAHRDVHTLL